MTLSLLFLPLRARALWIFLAALALIFLVFDAASALAATAGTLDPAPNNHLVLPTDQIWAFVAGNISPLAAYVVNKFGPQVNESVKAMVFVVVAAVAAGLTQAITAGDVGFNATTLQFIVTGVVGALLAHKWFWLPSMIGPKVGAGHNKAGQPAGPLQAL